MKNKLMFIIFLLLIFSSIVYADNTIVHVDNFNNVAGPNGKKFIYITNMSNYQFTINDTANFKTLNDGTETSVVLYNKPTSDKTYVKPFSITFNRIGYYIDDNGNPVYLTGKITVDEIFYDWNDSTSIDISQPYYRVAMANGSWFDLRSEAFDDEFKWGQGNGHVGMHDKLTFSFYNADGSTLSNTVASSLYFQWKIYDLDMEDRTVEENQYSSERLYRESFKFNTGFDNRMYVLNGTFLEITNDNSKFSATHRTRNYDELEDSNPHFDYSTVVANQIGATATGEWWGTACGTSIISTANQYQYPGANIPTKSTNKSTYKVNETVDYSINIVFPYTESYNKAKKIELIDEFDKYLNITNLTYHVYDASNSDVTSKWKKTVNGQKVVLQYNGNNTSEIYGNYTFKFENIKVMLPNESYQSKNVNGVIYRIIPNSASVTTTLSDDNIIKNETNIVNIEVGDNVIDNPKTGMKTILILEIIIISTVLAVMIKTYITSKILK